MASQIDPNKPATTHAFSADMRKNFQYARDEISALQSGLLAAIRTLFASGNSVGNGADTSEDVLKSFALPANTLANNGDIVHVVAGGTFAATTDSKTVRVRIGDLSGPILASPSGALTTATSWHAEAWIMRTGVTTQTFTSTGSVANSGNTNGTLSLNGSLNLAQQQTILVTGRNTTSSSAGSITCAYFHVEYKQVNLT